MQHFVPAFRHSVEPRTVPSGLMGLILIWILREQDLTGQIWPSWPLPSEMWMRDGTRSVQAEARMASAWRDFFFRSATAPSGAEPPHCRGFVITLIHTTLGRNPLDRWLARSKDLYLTTHNTQKTQTSVPPAAFQPAIPTSKRPKTHAFVRPRGRWDLLPRGYWYK
jgi:hypothetical protein